MFSQFVDRFAADPKIIRIKQKVGYYCNDQKDVHGQHRFPDTGDCWSHIVNNGGINQGQDHAMMSKPKPPVLKMGKSGGDIWGNDSLKQARQTPEIQNFIEKITASDHHKRNKQIGQAAEMDW